MNQSFYNIKTFRTFTSLKQTYIFITMEKTKGFIRRLRGIVPPYRCCNSAMPLPSNVSVLAMGKAMPFLFAKVKSQPFNGSFVKSPKLR